MLAIHLLSERKTQGRPEVHNFAQGTRKAFDRTIKSWKLILLLVLAAAFAAVSALGPAQLALADAGGVKGHSFDNTFTKWVTSFGTPPVLLNMVGVVGGDVGAGTYAGEVLSDSSVCTIETLVAL